jgi:hypothetical protein
MRIPLLSIRRPAAARANNNKTNVRRVFSLAAGAAGVLLAATTYAQAVSFTVSDADFVGGVYDFHFYNDLNNTATSATVINGVNQSVSNPTLTNSNWTCCDQDANSSGVVRYWKSTSALAGALTMGWDLSGVTGVIQSIELKTSHNVGQFGQWIGTADGDTIYGQIATPASYGTGTYTDLYRYTVPSGSGAVTLDSNNLFSPDITSFLAASWLNNPDLLELKLGYDKANTDIPTRHIQVFRDNTGSGDDGFYLRITLAPSEVPVPAALPLFASGLGVMGLLGWRRRRKARTA